MWVPESTIINPSASSSSSLARQPYVGAGILDGFCHLKHRAIASSDLLTRDRIINL
jgi:hypothetical protein